jgi:hypothetical protein
MAFMIGENLKSRSIDSKTGYTNLALVLANPRIGYGITFSDNIGLWSKAGFTYSKMFNGHLEEDQVWVNIDSNLVITPISNVGITGGLSFDDMINQRQISRGYSVINNSNLISFGFQFGAFTYF